MKKPRVIVVGAAWYGDWAKNFYEACLRLGLDASIVYNNSAPAPLGGGSDAVTSLFEKAKRFAKSAFGPKLFRSLKLARRRLAEYEIVARVKKVPATEPAIVVFVWTPGSVWILKKLKRRTNVKLVLWLGEPPIREPWWETTYGYFDHLYIVDEGIWMEELPPHEQKRVKLLPLSSDDAIFRPLAKKTGQYAADISFVGQYLASRAAALQPFAGDDLKIYGFGWEKGFEQFPYLKQCYRGPLPTAALNDVYNETKVVIGTLGAPKDPHTTATMRTFDISLAGGFQVPEPVALTTKIFGRSIPIYHSEDEFVRIVKHYLAHDDERTELAKEANVVAQNHSYTSRAKEVLRACGFTA